jgi:predicted nuclease of predicted toxin-antitoxin system
MKEVKLLLDENIGIKTYNFLEEKGINVDTVINSVSGATDKEVLKKAVDENRIAVTLDRDFGRLVFQDPKEHIGVLFLRLKKETPENISQTIARVVKNYSVDIYGKFVTVTDSKIRFS